MTKRLSPLMLLAAAAAGACGDGLFDAEGRPELRTICGGGGEVRSRDGRLVLAIPRGALRSCVDVEVRAEAVEGAVGSGYRVTPEDEVLAAPAVLTLRTDAALPVPPVVSRIGADGPEPLPASGEITRFGVFAAIAACSADADCPAGRCDGGSCVPDGCRIDDDCGPGLACVDGACTCARTCAADEDCGPGSFCSADPCGGCVACGAGELACDGACVPEDERNCGSCGTACQGAERCVNGGCAACDVAETCGDGLDNDCDGVVDDGCNVGLCESDADCAPAERCVAGYCQGVCAPGEVPCFGACVVEDERNCGACGNACEAWESCVRSACVGPPCRSDADCAAGQACVNGVCE